MVENTLNNNAKRGGRQFSIFMSENICVMADLFDKAVAEGGEIITGRKATMRHRNIDRNIYSHKATVASL